MIWFHFSNGYHGENRDKMFLPDPFTDKDYRTTMEQGREQRGPSFSLGDHIRMIKYFSKKSFKEGETNFLNST